MSLSEQVMFVLFQSYRTGQVSLSEQVMFVSFKSYKTGQVSLSEQVMFVSFLQDWPGVTVGAGDVCVV